MAITIYNERTHPQRFSLAPLKGRTVAIIGYGNQGRAQALCMRDSGVMCVVGARERSSGFEGAERDGMKVCAVSAAAAQADLVIMALPDPIHAEVFATQIDPSLRAGATVGFLHGYSVRFGGVAPRAGTGVVLLAPKGPGATLRSLYLEGKGLPALYALHQNSNRGDSQQLAFAWAAAIGAGRSGVIATTFATEAETDLFGEQAVLCGGVLALMLTAFETLTEAGYEPELAYLECCHELKQVADLLYARGPAGMAEAISDTAEFGTYRTLPVLADEHVRGRMRELLQAIRNGAFAKEFRSDAHAGFRWFLEQRGRLREHSINTSGESIRALMPWLRDE